MGSAASSAHDLTVAEKAHITTAMRTKFDSLKLLGMNEADIYVALAMEHEILLQSILSERDSIDADFQNKPRKTNTSSSSPNKTFELLSQSDGMLHSVSATFLIPDDGNQAGLGAGDRQLRKSLSSEELHPGAKTAAEILVSLQQSSDDFGRLLQLQHSPDYRASPTSQFRKRRLTMQDQSQHDSPKDPVEVAKRTSIFASSEIGVTVEKAPPFPHNILGTFSCHGIEPEYSEDDEEVGIIQKINQDRGCVVYPFNKSRAQALLMVLDGHGSQGNRVSEFAMRHLILHLEMSKMGEPEFAFSTAFNDVNEELKTSDINFMTSGTTCVAMYIFGFIYYVAHVGDSRAVVARRKGGELLAVDLTIDHKPDTPAELARIEACGGFVGSPDEEGLSSRVYLDKECTKVGIAVARSIGDFIVKDVGVVSDPDVTEHTWTPEDAFFILASDGVWEFISSQAAVDIVAANIEQGAHHACQILIETAMEKWKEHEGDYRDDITAIVLITPLPFQESAEALNAAMSSRLPPSLMGSPHGTSSKLLSPNVSTFQSSSRNISRNRSFQVNSERVAATDSGKS